MRTNTPVSNVEYELKAGASIVSKTDLKGIITFVNPDFIEASGFTEKELIGQSHNLVRHPDMPEEAFADMWTTLKAGKPWAGLVKNRRKNGDHYWVVANATPIYENGIHTGYLSVRSKPGRAQIEAASAAYHLFKEKRQGSMQIKEGKVVKETAWSRLNVFARRSIRAKLMSLIGLMSVFIVLVGYFGLNGMHQTMDNSDQAVQEDWLPQVQVYKIATLTQRDRVLIMDAVMHPTPENIKKRMDEFEKNKAETSK